MSQTRAQLLKGFNNTSASEQCNYCRHGSGRLELTSPVRWLAAHFKNGGNATSYSAFKYSCKYKRTVLFFGKALRQQQCVDWCRLGIAQKMTHICFLNASSTACEELDISCLFHSTATRLQVNALDDYEEGTWTPTVKFFFYRSLQTVATCQLLYKNWQDLSMFQCEIRSIKRYSYWQSQYIVVTSFCLYSFH